ncbi:MAG: GNAT family N-acetyltransferase [Clostridia bacterium]|nr:GNAT family N-acetyltransferase [Clostridia bacterium]
MSITIEKATAADAAEMLAFLKQVGGETDNLTFGGEGLPFSVEAEAGYLAGMEDSTDNIILVAKEDGKIIGNASLSRMSRRMSHRGDFSIVVAKAFWNRGIGGQLLRTVLDFARENDFEKIDLQVRSDNVNAIHLYEKYGFVKLCTYPAFFKINGEYADVEFMCLQL